MARAIEAVINVIFPVVYVLWRIVAFVFSLIWKVISDIFKNVYGRVVVAIGAGIFAYLAYVFSGLHL